MPLFDAALAFALTMLVIATAVSYLVDFIHWALSMRGADLRVMLGEYYQQELQPVIQRELARLSTKIDATSTSEIQQATQALANVDLKPLIDNRIHVPTTELIEQLKRSQLGIQLLTRLGNDAESVFSELAKRYEVLGDKYSATFRSKARLISMLVAFVLALVINIDSVNILKAYVSNQGLRESAVAQYDRVLAEHEKVTAPATNDKNQELDNIAKLRDALNAAKGELSELNSAGFPIGWTYFPYTRPETVTMGAYVLWGIGIILTAIFAGLGSPFWYDVLRGLGNFSQQQKKDTAL